MADGVRAGRRGTDCLLGPAPSTSLHDLAYFTPLLVSWVFVVLELLQSGTRRAADPRSADVTSGSGAAATRPGMRRLLDYAEADDTVVVR
nr:hypothetical protein [Nakamurella antarctica]